MIAQNESKYRTGDFAVVYNPSTTATTIVVGENSTANYPDFIDIDLEKPAPEIVARVKFPIPSNQSKRSQVMKCHRRVYRSSARPKIGC